jgi:hypothetical protein
LLLLISSRTNRHLFLFAKIDLYLRHYSSPSVSKI